MDKAESSLHASCLPRLTHTPAGREKDVIVMEGRDAPLVYGGAKAPSRLLSPTSRLMEGHDGVKVQLLPLRLPHQQIDEEPLEEMSKKNVAVLVSSTIKAQICQAAL